MASYKLDVLSRLGKFHRAFYDATGAKGDPRDSEAIASLDDLCKAITADIEAAGLDEESDTIIFRNIAYDNYSQLTREVKRATY